MTKEPKLDDDQLIVAACKHDLIEPVGIHLRCYSCGVYMDDYNTEELDPNDYRDSLMDEYLEREINDDI